MKRYVAVGAIALLAAGCHASPPTGRDPAPPHNQPTHAPVSTLGVYTDQKVDVLIVNGPQTMTAGKTESLTARLMAPPGTQVVGLVPTPSQDGFTYTLQMAVKVPANPGPNQPLEVQIPFTPGRGGTYFFHLADNHRFAVQVSPAEGYGFGSTGGYGSGFGSPSPSSYDRAADYGWGAYTPGGSYSGNSLTPSTVDASPSAPLFGTTVQLASVTGGAVLGNPNVTTRQIIALQGPTYGQHGQWMRWRGELWTAGTGPIQADVVQDASNELTVKALVAPAAEEPIAVPMPRETTVDVSWNFQTPGLYRIVSGDGITLAMVTVY